MKLRYLNPLVWIVYLFLWLVVITLDTFNEILEAKQKKQDSHV